MLDEQNRHQWWLPKYRGGRDHFDMYICNYVYLKMKVDHHIFILSFHFHFHGALSSFSLPSFWVLFVGRHTSLVDITGKQKQAMHARHVIVAWKKVHENKSGISWVELSNVQLSWAKKALYIQMIDQGAHHSIVRWGGNEDEKAVKEIVCRARRQARQIWLG